MDPNTCIGAVTLNVAELPVMEAFYRDLIGLQVGESAHGVVALRTPERTLERPGCGHPHWRRLVAMWRQMPAATDMGHVHFMVSEVGSKRQFYVELCGFHIETEYQQSAPFVAAGDYHHDLGLNTWHALSENGDLFVSDPSGMNLGLKSNHKGAREAAVN